MGFGRKEAIVPLPPKFVTFAPMLTRFAQHIAQHQLLPPQTRVLLAVSGGADSIVMLHLFRRMGADIAVAHCNFRLRGAESDADEAFVRGICQELGVPLRVAQFDTLAHAQQHGISIEMAARELRYRFFGQMASELGCQRIAVAHNLDDQAETLLLNLLRGTGIRGLAAMRPLSGRIIRPLLFAPRADIERYAQLHRIAYRTDSTNASTEYKRNKLRHNVMPQLRSINPSAAQSIAATAAHVQQALALLEQQLAAIAQQAVAQLPSGHTAICIDALPPGPTAELFVVEELMRRGLSAGQAAQAAALLNAPTGRRVEAGGLCITRDRQHLVLVPLTPPPGEVLIDAGCVEVDYIVHLLISTYDDAQILPADRRPQVALLDRDRLQFPLRLRTWQAGDRFVPLGMRGRKKLSDFLTDQKLPAHLKRRAQVLLSANGDVVWVVGYRIDARYAIGPATRRVLRIERV